MGLYIESETQDLSVVAKPLTASQIVDLISTEIRSRVMKQINTDILIADGVNDAFDTFFICLAVQLPLMLSRLLLLPLLYVIFLLGLSLV